MSAADLIITGEGKLDSQTASGKVCSAVAALARKHAKECIAVVGMNQLSEASLAQMGISKVYQCMTEEMTKEESLSNTGGRLIQIAEAIVLDYGDSSSV